jgi:hypothetical protein
MADVDWDRVRVELAGTPQVGFPAGKAVIFGKNSLPHTRAPLPVGEPSSPQAPGLADFDPGDADASSADAADPLLDHIALALANRDDPSF